MGVFRVEGGRGRGECQRGKLIRVAIGSAMLRPSLVTIAATVLVALCLTVASGEAQDFRERPELVALKGGTGSRARLRSGGTSDGTFAQCTVGLIALVRASDGRPNQGTGSVVPSTGIPPIGVIDRAASRMRDQAAPRFESATRWAMRADYIIAIIGVETFWPRSQATSRGRCAGDAGILITRRGLVLPAASSVGFLLAREQKSSPFRLPAHLRDDGHGRSSCRAAIRRWAVDFDNDQKIDLWVLRPTSSGRWRRSLRSRLAAWRAGDAADRETVRTEITRCCLKAALLRKAAEKTTSPSGSPSRRRTAMTLPGRRRWVGLISLDHCRGSDE